MRVFVALIFLPLILAVKKIFLIEHIVNCSGGEDLPLDFHLEVNNSAKIPNRLFLSGYLEAKQKVTGPLELSSEDNRCDLNSENCEKHSGFKVDF